VEVYILIYRAYSLLHLYDPLSCQNQREALAEAQKLKNSHVIQGEGRHLAMIAEIFLYFESCKQIWNFSRSHHPQFI
jgi:hypothetical protein